MGRKKETDPEILAARIARNKAKARESGARYRTPERKAAKREYASKRFKTDEKVREQNRISLRMRRLAASLTRLLTRLLTMTEHVEQGLADLQRSLVRGTPVEEPAPISDAEIPVWP